MKYDIAIVGAGPIGSLCAIAHAQKGARVALFEGNPKASTRLAGEWLHPPALRMLENVSVRLEPCGHGSIGKGFVVTPEDQSDPILLPYAQDTVGLTFEHSALVAAMHSAIAKSSDIDCFQPAKVREVDDGLIVFKHEGFSREVNAPRIVGADGRSSIVRRSLGLASERLVCSRMIGVLVEGVSVPFTDYGHVLLGGPGPILMFQLGEGRVRIIVDVPLSLWNPSERVSALTESYGDLLPRDIREAFVSALRDGRFQAAGNEIRPRFTYGNSKRVLIGDAAGNYHPLTAVGMTLGFGDAYELADNESFPTFERRRLAATRAPELLAMGLYEVFVDYRKEAAALRNEVYRTWRVSHTKRERTMQLLACEDTSVFRLAVTFFGIVARAILKSFPISTNPDPWRPVRGLVAALTERIGGFIRGSQTLRKPKLSTEQRRIQAHDQLSRALLTSMQTVKGNTHSRTSSYHETSIDVSDVIDKAVAHLLSIQADDGSWEGEMVWCPMLSAQYVLLHHVLGKPISENRQRLLLRQFAASRLAGGMWGLHDHSQPYLFVTTLVYVAARMLGLSRDDELIADAGEFIRTEGVLQIPSWGKFWLSVLNLYEWEGLNAVLPELWRLPRWLPLHPSKWYCHTRLIYMAMAVVYASRHRVRKSQLIGELRDELYGQDFEHAEFAKSRLLLRKGDLFAEPTRLLQIGYRLIRLYERIHYRGLRKRCVDDMLERIRWELASSSHTSISPVSGFLNILALWLHDHDDIDAQRAFSKLDDWMWEDEIRGIRVTGARSASWDTGFSLQALATVQTYEGLAASTKLGMDFLKSQQITDSFDGYENAFRNDPKGGWCFAGIWHGWPVSDCTAEATLGILSTEPRTCDSRMFSQAIEFMLRCQNKNGGFGSYEANRSPIDLEWMNPAEMFGESMTEKSYVECTASCLAALAEIDKHYPMLSNPELKGAMNRGSVWLRREQNDDGSWRGVWGVQYIYGTMFGIRGLLATGAPESDPAVRTAANWLLARQHADGGWGEHHSGCQTAEFVDHAESQVVQTAWALIALLESNDSNWTAISRGIQYLVDSQTNDGTWPRQDMAGVFFRTALLDYVLYRQYFPLHALGLYERRRRYRQKLTAQNAVESEVETMSQVHSH
ncbi:MAG: FAD-dependent monooxygenase [Gammaproteobacteria bacterium]|nr:FAD-dependent monooxygenase [Gammaproteobacteria bacterium]